MLLEILLVVAMFTCVASLFAFAMALKAYITVEAMKNSTHQVQYMDPTQNVVTDNEGFEEITDYTSEKLTEEDDLFGDELTNHSIKY